MSDKDIAIPDEAVTVAAEAMEDAAIEHLGRDLGTVHRNDIARAALAAAAPLIRAAELERQADIVQGWREDGDDEPDFRSFRDHLRACAYELRAQPTP